MMLKHLKTTIYTLGISVLLISATACATAPQAAAPSAVVPSIAPPSGQMGTEPSADLGKNGPVACPRLQAPLYELSLADDPAAFAAEFNLPFEDDRVLVFVFFSAPINFEQYDAIVTAQVDERAQALVPVDQLCVLANDPNVIRVSPPDMAIPQRP